MFSWFRRWRLERAAKYVLKNLSRVQGKERGFLIIWEGMLLCCYDIDDDASWEHVLQLRKSVKDESVVINPIDRSHHDGDGGFREQICALYYTGLWDDSWAKFVKSCFHVCQPGAASLDPKNPGADTLAAWQAADELIENENVRGFYHTHPGGAWGFSPQDYRLIAGFARANGEMPLWHVVQAADANVAAAVCANMINNQVFIYKLGMFPHDPSDPILLLPLPIKVERLGSSNVNVIDLTSQT